MALSTSPVLVRERKRLGKNQDQVERGWTALVLVSGWTALEGGGWRSGLELQRHPSLLRWALQTGVVHS